jgi:predicted transcriptional regulator
MALRVNHSGYVAKGEREDFCVTYEGELRGDLARRLLSIADRKRRKPVDLLAQAVEKLIEDDLFAAVIDDG